MGKNKTLRSKISHRFFVETAIAIVIENQGQLEWFSELDSFHCFTRFIALNLLRGSPNAPGLGSRDHDVVLVGRTISSGKPRGVENSEWGGDGEGTGKGRSVQEQPGAKVDRIASRQRRASK
jgi:hypothetical protein